MPSLFTFPTSADLEEIEQDMLPRLEADRPLSQFFPTENKDADVILWEQMDSYYGLQQARGLNGEFPSVPKTQGRRTPMTPGVYGEFEPIDEAELTTRRKYGTFAEPIDISDLVAPIQTKLLQRRLDRQEWILWQFLVNGQISVAGPNGATVVTGAYNVQKFTATVPWATTATATPSANFRLAKLLGRGYSVDFGAKAYAFMNSQTFNYLALNTNPADLYGRRLQWGATANNLASISALLQGDDLPQIVVYDKVYRTTPTQADGTFGYNLYIPNNTVIIIGERPGGRAIGKYQYTRNANNPGMGPGPYMEVIDTMGGPEGSHRRPPRTIEVYDGHNGGMKLMYGSAIINMAV